MTCRDKLITSKLDFPILYIQSLPKISASLQFCQKYNPSLTCLFLLQQHKITEKKIQMCYNSQQKPKNDWHPKVKGVSHPLEKITEIRYFL